MKINCSLNVKSTKHKTESDKSPEKNKIIWIWIKVYTTQRLHVRLTEQPCKD